MSGPELADKNAFVLPMLPQALKVDPLLAGLLHVTAFLELSGDEAVDPDWAVEAMEHVGHYLQRLPAERIEVLRAQLAQVAAHARQQQWSPEAVEFVEKFLSNFGIGEDDQ